MRRLVTIDLHGADVALFEAYEAVVLPLLATHGGRLELRLRAIDGTSETHLLSFPDAPAYDRYRADPARLAAQSLWESSRAISTAIEVITIGAPDVPLCS